LLPHLKNEIRLTGILDAITRTTEGKDVALILIKQAIICITWRIMLEKKIITMLLSIGAERFQKERWAAALDEYITMMQRCVCTRIFGMRLYPKQWKFPTMNGGKEVSKTVILTRCSCVCSFGIYLLHYFCSLLQVGKIKLSNKNTCKFIKNVDVIVVKFFRER
jgi:hypothetical protein